MQTRAKNPLAWLSILALALIAAIWFFFSRGATNPPLSGGEPVGGLPKEGGALSSLEPAAEDGRQLLGSLSSPTATPPIESTSDSRASVQFLCAHDRTPIPGSRWQFASAAREGETAANLSLETDDRGRVRLEPRRWSLSNLDGRYAPASNTVELEQTPDVVVWVQRTRALTIIVVTSAEVPVPGAKVYWIPRMSSTEPYKPPPRGHLNLFESDASGRATVKGCPTDFGTVVVLAEGYERETRVMCGSVDGPLRIVVWPASGPSRSIHFVSAVDRAPILAVHVEGMEGYPIAATTAAENSLDLPSWIRPDELLRVVSAHTIPAHLRLDRMSSDEVVLYSAIVVRAIVRDPSRCATSARVGVTVDDDTFQGAEPSPDLVTSYELQVDTPADLQLPAGPLVSVLGTNACGASAHSSMDGGSLTNEIELVLRRESQGEIRVSGTDGRALTSARALVLQGENDLVLSASSSGMIVVPDVERATYIQVSAPEHSDVILLPRSGAARREQDWRWAVTLEPSVTFSLRVISSDQKPLAGMRVAVWWREDLDGSRMPHGSAELSAAEGIDVGRPRSFTGLTDDDGRFVVRGLRPGLMQIETEVDRFFGSDELDRGLYIAPPQRIRVTEPSEHVIVVVPPRKLSLEVVDALDSRPVIGFRISDSASSITQVVRGCFWQGWVAADSAFVNVTADDQGSATVRLDSAPSDEVVKVRLQHSPVATLMIRGLPASAHLGAVSVEVWRKDEDGSLLWAGHVQVEIDEYGRGALSVPYDGDLFIGVQDKQAGQKLLRFKPEWLPYSTSGELVFHCYE